MYTVVCETTGDARRAIFDLFALLGVTAFENGQDPTIGNAVPLADGAILNAGPDAFAPEDAKWIADELSQNALAFALSVLK